MFFFDIFYYHAKPLFISLFVWFAAEFIYLFIQTYLYRVKTLLAIGYFAYVPCYMTSICIQYGNTYLSNNYHMYNDYNN